MNDAPRPQFEDVADVLRHQLSRRTAIGGGAAALTAFLAACSGKGSYSDKPANDKPAAT